MEFNIDLTQVPELRPLPSGVYIVRILSGKTGQSQTGNQKITWETEVLEPIAVATKIPKWYFTSSLADGALFRLKQLYLAAGVLRPGSFSIEELIGCEVGVAVTLETSEQYGTRNQTTAFYRVTETKPNVTDAEIQKADALHAAAGASSENPKSMTDSSPF